MSVVRPGLRWIVIGFLAFLAFAAFGPRLGYGQQGPGNEVTADPECEGGAEAATPPTKVPITSQTNIYPDQVKKPDLAIFNSKVYKVDKLGTPLPTVAPNSPGFDSNGPFRKLILTKRDNVHSADVDTLAKAIAAINAEFLARGRKLNVVISGHGYSGNQSVGRDWMGTDFPVNQAAFIAAMTNPDKIEHLTFLGCEVGAPPDGLQFLQKLQVGLHASVVQASMKKMWPKGKFTIVRGTATPPSARWDPQTEPIIQVDSVGPGTPTPVRSGFYVEGTGVPMLVVTPGPIGGVSLDPQLPGSPGGGAGLLAGAMAAALAGAFALGGGVLYARRRRVQ